MMFKSCLLLLAGCVLCAQAWNYQSTSVQGRIYCEHKPAEGVKVKLIDMDIANSDDLMAKGVTNKDGSYSLSGYSWDIFTDIDPVVEIKFNCGTFFDKCYQFKVPDSYVVDGKTAKRVFKATDVELSSVKQNC